MSLEKLRIEVNNWAEIIGAPKDYLPTFGIESIRNDGHPFVDYDGLSYQMVFIEHDKEYERIESQSIEEIIYWIFEWVTHLMAKDFERQNRDENVDFRRMLFKKQEELLGMISSKYSERLKEGVRKILISNPYNDHLFPPPTIEE